MSELNWTYEAADQLRHHWTQQLRPRLTGLTDREYFWEPVTDAWRSGREGSPQHQSKRAPETSRSTSPSLSLNLRL